MKRTAEIIWVEPSINLHLCGQGGDVFRRFCFEFSSVLLLMTHGLWVQSSARNRHYNIFKIPGMKTGWLVREFCLFYAGSDSIRFQNIYRILMSWRPEHITHFLLWRLLPCCCAKLSRAKEKRRSEQAAKKSQFGAQFASTLERNNIALSCGPRLLTSLNNFKLCSKQQTAEKKLKERWNSKQKINPRKNIFRVSRVWSQ